MGAMSIKNKLLVSIETKHLFYLLIIIFSNFYLLQLSSAFLQDTARV